MIFFVIYLNVCAVYQISMFPDILEPLNSCKNLHRTGNCTHKMFSDTLYMCTVNDTNERYVTATVKSSPVGLHVPYFLI